MKAKRSFLFLLFIVFALIFSACSALENIFPQDDASTGTNGGTPTSDASTSSAGDSGAVVPSPTAAEEADPLVGLATVESVEIQTLESFPVQINVRVRGVLPDNCTVIDDVITQQEGNSFEIAMTSVQRSAPECVAEEVLFEETVPLDVEGLEAGSYTVAVNGIQGSFNLDVDNVAGAATSTPAAQDTAATYAINGRVWHDVCAGGAAAAGSEPPEGCVAAADGTFIADGLDDDEPGIEGVLVDLGQGSCPAAEVIVTASTDTDGAFSFGNLRAAEYCISVDTASLQNNAILEPGLWTEPAGEEAQATVTVGEDEAAQEVNFGWDFGLLPADLSDCDNSFEFVEDLTVPDDTAFPPGQEFTKEWRLRNNGTCPWSTEYAIQFVGGDLLGAEETISLTQTVAISGTLDIAVDMVAPDEPGTYRGNWQLADPDGEPFGINGIIDDAFWLRIVVEEGAEPVATPLPNSAAIGGVVWDDFCINSDPGTGCVDSGSGTSIGNGSFQSFESALSEITISLAQGACPAEGNLPTGSAVIETTLTDVDGRYLFEDLADGNYCIFMDALSPENVDLLIPGNWTWPATGVGRYNFILDPGEQALDLDFGWDFVD
ncbi:MAG: NBR1-Ig-like domain-containing protein [Candidatus Promineifilaceae bacterium]|nr:NBR1-Ig-like domain-containing protein [Candidatus Promineifilaceae bacterium]